MKSKSPRAILLQALKRKQRKNKDFSLRLLGKKLRLSHAYLSQVLAGKKMFPQKHYKQIVEALEIDEIGERSLKYAILFESLENSPVAMNCLEDLLKTVLPKINPSLTKYTERSEKNFILHSSWVHLAIMDLVTCSNFQDDPKWIAKRLAIPTSTARYSLEVLIERGLLQRENGKLSKTDLHVRFPTLESHPLIRQYHRETALKGLQHMDKNTDLASFKQRLIVGSTVAVNPDNLREARDLLYSSLGEVLSVLSAGDCTEVYHLNALLFPLTKS